MTHVALIIILCTLCNIFICLISLVRNTLGVGKCCSVSGSLILSVVEGRVNSFVCPMNLVVNLPQLKILLALCFSSRQVGHVERALPLDQFIRYMVA